MTLLFNTMATPFPELIPIVTLGYTTEEKEAVAKLRILIDDVLKERHNFDSDTCLIKWLRSWKLNVSKTEKMIRQNIEYFEVNGLDYIDKWQIPEVVERYLPHGTYGEDREGHPVQYNRFGRTDMQGMSHSISKIELVRNMHKNNSILENKFVEQSKKWNKKIDKMILIIDLEGINLSHLYPRPLSYSKQIIRAASDNYAGSMEFIFVITNSPLFRFIWEIACHILDDETKQKVHIIRPTECGEKLGHYIAPDQLLRCYGGTVPQCSDTIGMGGTIPETYYLKNVLEHERGTELNLVPIRARSFAQIPIIVEESRSILCWIFKTQNYDINFGIYFKPTEESKLNCVLSLHRCDSNLVPDKGDIMCLTPGTYVLYWDNTYSWFHNKQVQYVCNVVKPNTIFS